MKVSLAALCAMAVLSTSIAASAEADSVTYNLDIPAQKLNDALQALAFASQHKLLYSSKLVDGKYNPGLKGNFTAEEAVKKLLSGTNLVYQLTTDDLLVIKDRNSSMPLSMSGVQGNDKARLAQSDTSSSSQEVSQGEDQKSTSPATGEGAPKGADEDKSKVQDIQEIIVTAQKREERLQDVPISISVLGGDQLDRSTVEGITEALRRVPGVATFVSHQGGGTQVAVRGVTAGGSVFAGSSPISYYLDSVPFGLVKTAIAPDASAYDLERVEVLRGPQGTLYGATALNGVVRVLTKDANLNKFEFKARTSASGTERGGENYRGDMAVNVPIVEDKLAVRAAVGYQDLSGWLHKPNRKDANDAEIATMRLKVNAQPTEQLSIGLSAWLSRSDYGAPSVGLDNEIQSNPIDESISTDYDVYGLKIGYDFGGFSVSSMTSYLDYANTGNLDLNFLGLPSTLFTGFDSDVFSQEFILNSTYGGAWRWSAGGMYRDGEDRLLQTLPPFLPAPTDLSDLSESFAVFGELTRLFLDGRLELTGGLRYFEDEVTNRENVPYDGNFARPLKISTSKFDALSPRVVLTWHPGSDLTVYGSYSEGFRSGFPQNPQALAVDPTFGSLDPDTLINYELGAKGSLGRGGRVNFETALYYIDWQDVQQTLIVRSPQGVPFTALINGESASGMGFDVGLTAQPVDGLEMGVNFSWNDLAMDADVINANGVRVLAKGDRLNNSAEYTAGVSADYAFSLGGNGFQGRLSASWNHITPQNARGRARLTQADALTIARTSFSIDAPDHWSATLFADNVTDERGSNSPAPPAFRNWAPRVRPRTVGVQFEYRY